MRSGNGQIEMAPARTRRAALQAALGVAVSGRGWATERDEIPDELRMAFSERGLYDMNMTDARVALTVWTRRLGERMGTRLTMSPKVFESTEEILLRLQRKTVDAVAVSTPEYLQLAGYLDPSRFLIEGTPKDRQYVLLVKNGSGIERASSLQGRTLSIWSQLKMSMARPWFTTLLYAGRRAPHEAFQVKLVEESKAMRAVLSVFFDKADACITNRSTFEGIVDLNPQVGRQLRVMAESPSFVTSVYMFRRGFSAARKESYINTIASLESDPGLRQVMSLFKSTTLFAVEPAAMKDTLAVLEVAKGLPGGIQTIVRKETV